VRPFFSGLTTDASSFTAGVPGGETLPLKWFSGGNVPQVSLLLDHPSWAYPQYIARAIPNGGVYLWNVPQSLAAGSDYSVIVWFSPQVYNRSSTFSIADPCGYINCGTYGTCNNGICECLSGYTGTQCTLSPCAAAQCNTLHSTCDDTVGVCNCTGGYTGARCMTSPSCTEPCNNGYRSEDLIGGCSSCICNNQWSGAACDTCNLKCENGFAPDASCSTCQCGTDTGFYGDQCQCRYLTGSIKLKVTDASWVTSDATADSNLWRFNATFANDLAAAVPGTSAAMFSVQSVTVVSGGVLVSFYIMQNCPKVSQEWQSGDMMMLDTSPIVMDWSSRRLLQATETELTSAPLPANITSNLRLQVLDTDSGMYKGVITSHADMSTLQMSDDPTTGGQSTMFGLTTTVWIGILAGVGVVIAAIVVGICCYRSKKAKKLNDMLDHSAGEYSGAITATSPSANSAPYEAAETASPTHTPNPTSGTGAPSRFIPAAPAKKPLPLNWSLQKSNEGHPYWFNAVTGESTWIQPTA